MRLGLNHTKAMVLIVRKRQMSENIRFQHPRPKNYLWFPVLEVDVVLRGGEDDLNNDFRGGACCWKIVERPAGKLSIPTYVLKCKVWVPAAKELPSVPDLEGQCCDASCWRLPEQGRAMACMLLEDWVRSRLYSIHADICIKITGLGTHGHIITFDFRCARSM